ncbi:hypothetical protein ACF0H5_021353 [Mactra antiquata]
MRFVVNKLKLLKPLSASCLNFGTKKGVYSVTTGIITNARPEVVKDEPRKTKETFRLPFEIIKNGRLHLHFHECNKFNGKFTKFKVLNKNFIALNSLQDVESVFNSKNGAEGRLSPFFQDYVLNNDGFAFQDFTKVCQQQKQVVRAALTYHIKTHNVLVKEEISKTLDKISVCSHEIFDSDIYIRNFLTNVFTRLLIGETLPEDHPDRNALWDLIHLLYQLMDPSIDTPLRNLPFLRFLPIKHGRLFRDAIKTRDRVSRLYFDSQKESYKDGEIRGLVDVCLKIQSNESWLTDDKIKGLMYDTVIAGMSEMMKSIRMLVLLMCHYQDTQSRVHAEIDEVIGSRNDVTATDKDKMPYTVAVIMEMLRYVSQTPLAIPHKCNNDVMLDGYVIEKNSGIFPNIWSIHHDDDVWGDPWCFRPDRFLTDEGSLLPSDHKHRRTLIPFSVGRRRCPGEDFAMSGLFIVFTKMLQKVQFLPPKNEDLPSVDPRDYNNKYPLYLPVFKCRVVPRDES